MRRRFAALGTVLVLGSLIAFAGATPAYASGPDFTPSGSRAKAYMLNILGSVLKGAMPDKWRAEQLANAHRYNHSWEGLRAQFGQDPANPNYMGAPDSYDDYVLRKTEQDIRGGSNGRPMAAPATKTQRLMKGIGGAATVVTGLSLGTMAGQFGLELFGVDVDGLVCGSTDGIGQGLASLLTGADCDAWAFDPGYVPNADADGAWGTEWYCATYTGQGGWVPGEDSCIRWNGLMQSSDLSNRSWQWCVDLVNWPGSQGAWAGQWVSRSGNLVTAGTLVLQATGFQSLCPGGGPYLRESGTYTGPIVHPNPLERFRLTNLPGDPVWAVAEQESGDPARVLTCTITGSDGLTYTAQSEAYHESDGSVAAPECPTLPEGVVPANTTIGDGTNTLFDEDATDEFMDWWNAYPECRTGACKLDLITLENPSFPVSCFDLDDGCVDWFTDPNKTTKYECRYGIHTVDLAECNVYSGVFQPNRIQIGAPYSDPLTGEWSGGHSSPTPDGAALGQAVQDPSQPRACRGMDSDGLDPVAFVMRPVQCALEWAFAPRQAVMELEGANVASSWSNVAPGQIAGAVEGWEFAPAMTGCRIDFTHWETEQVLPIVDACEGSPMAPVAEISRVMSVVGAAVLAIIAIRRQIGATVDYQGH